MDEEPGQYEYPGTPDPLTVVEKPKAQRSADVGHQKNEIRKILLRKRLTFWSVLFSGVLTVTTIALMFIGYWQYQATNEAIRISETTFKLNALQQRPWVGVINSCLALEKEFFRSDGRCLPQHPQLFDIVKAGDRITTRVTVANVGTSPAMNAHIMVRWCIRDNLHHSPPPFESCVGEIGDADKANGLRPLLPNSAGDSAMEVTHSFSLSSVDDISAVREGRKRFFMRGRVTYDNGGTEKDLRAYHTDFCLLYDARYPTEQYSYYYCDNGQEAN